MAELNDTEVERLTTIIDEAFGLQPPMRNANELLTALERLLHERHVASNRDLLSRERLERFLHDHGPIITYALGLATSVPGLENEERRAEAFAAVEALGELRGEGTGGGTKECPACDVMAGATDPDCKTCHGTGRVPNDEAGR